jgi:hypothetical protein
VDFPTRFNTTSCSTIDNIFIDNSRINLFKVLPIINGLSDHDAQYLTLDNVFLLNRGNNSICKKRLITRASISNFVAMLKDESWSDVYSHYGVDKCFSSFLNSFLIYFESCFPMHHTTKKLLKNSWITQGIRISCKKKGSLYILSRNSNCPLIKRHYNQYCTILRKVIRNAKRNYYNSLLMTAENKSKITWNILNNELGKVKNNNHTPLMFTSGKTSFQLRFCSGGF